MIILLAATLLQHCF